MRIGLSVACRTSSMAFALTCSACLGAVDDPGTAPSAPACRVSTVPDENEVVIASMNTEGVQVPDGSAGSIQLPLLPDGIDVASSGVPFTPTGLQCDASQGFLHVAGTDVSEYGTRVQIKFSAPADLSSFSGISFWARSNLPGQRIRLVLPTANTDPEGSCMVGCYDYYGIQLQLGTTWQKLRVPFRRLAQEGFGTSVPLQTEATLAITWSLPRLASYDLWLDDVALYRD